MSQSQFTVTCPSCRAEVVLSAKRLLVRVDARRSTTGEVLFTCFGCHKTAAVALDASGVAALVMGGVTFLSLSPPVVEHPETRPPGPPPTTAAHTARPAGRPGHDWLAGLVSLEG